MPDGLLNAYGRVVCTRPMPVHPTPFRLPAFLVALVALPLLGMGALGGETSPAAPERNYAGVFFDREGVEVEAQWMNANGEVSLSGDLGRGTLRIPFDDIDRIEFSGKEADELTAAVHLREGKTVDLGVRNSLTFYGRTDLGLYRIRARDLKSVDLEH